MCNLLLRDVQNYIDIMLFEFSNEPDLRAQFAASRGMCAEHGHLLRYNKIGNMIGTSRLYLDTLDEVLKIMDDTSVEVVEQPRLQRLLGAQPRAESGSLAANLQPVTNCTACEHMDVVEKGYVDIFVKSLSDERFLTAFRASQGICLPHFRRIVTATQNPAHLDTLLDIQRTIWRNLRAELASFMDKQNYENEEPIGAEADSWVRAIMRMAGEKGVFGTRRNSD